MVDTAEKTRVFLSYSRADEAAVIALTKLLERDGEFDVFRDKEDILPAEDWRARLEGLILSADALVFCLTPDSARSEVAIWEVETAERLAKRIIPVVLRATEGDVPKMVARLNYIFLIDFQNDASVQQNGLVQLRNAIESNINWIREHTRIGELAERWVADGRRRADLLRGAALESAEKWLVLQPHEAPPPTVLQREFISTGRRATVQRQRWWVTGSLLVAAMAIGLSALAYWQRGIAAEQRTQANARRLAAESQLALASPLAAPEEAVRNLLISLSLSPSHSSEQALATGVNRLPPRSLGELPWPAGAAKLRALGFSHDGSWLGAATSNEALFWDVRDRRLVLRISLPHLEGDATVTFAKGAARALVSLRATIPKTDASWTFVDLKGGTTKTVTSAEAFDVKVVGNRILGLMKASENGVPALAELPEGTPALTKPSEGAASGPFGTPGLTLKTSARVVFGQFFDADVPLMFGGSIPRQRLALVQSDGSVTIWDIGGSGLSLAAKPLPKEASPLQAGDHVGTLAIRRPQNGDTVIDLVTGVPAWQASQPTAHFRGFVGGGRFIIVEDDQGVRLESVFGKTSVMVENSRRTDFDLNALNDVTRYTPIIGVEATTEAGQLVTAWKDGRIAVWEIGQKPRWGGIDALPSPNFEAIARFDHGETLGATVTWTAPPALFVAPSGRYVASQSMGIKTNSVGGVTAAHPLVRIWDTHRQGEIARFRPDTPMVLAFSPSDDLLLTGVVVPSGAADKDSNSPKLELWDLTEASINIGETSEITTLPVTMARAQPERPSPDRVIISAPANRLLAPIWIGADLRLRALNAGTGSVVLMDDLGPVIKDISARLHRRAAEVSGALSDNERGFFETLAAQFDQLSKAQKGWPPETPIALLPIVVSADGKRAFLGLGPTARLYALDGHPRYLRTFELGGEKNSVVLVPSSYTPATLLTSSDGSIFGAITMSISHSDASDPVKGSKEPSNAAQLSSQILVFHTDSEVTFQSPPRPIVFAPPVAYDLDRAVAVTGDGRLVALDSVRRSQASGSPPRITAQLVVRELASGNEVIKLPTRVLTPDPLGLKESGGGGGDRVAAFDSTGKRLLVLREAPDCPLKTVVNMAWMPVSVPICVDRRATLTLWDLTSAEKIGETNFILPSARGGRTLAASTTDDFMTAATMATLAQPQTATTSLKALLALSTDGVAEIQFVEPRLVLASATAKLELARIRMKIKLDQPNPLIAAACQRLPSNDATITKKTWGKLLPAEDYRPICAGATSETGH
jgi:WD40 repeat protein